MDGLTVRYGRRTPAAQRLLERVALALGGQAGGRQTTHMAVPTSGSTLLRAVHRLVVPSPPMVEVLGVDEFSLRRGRVFGTILVDMASRRPVDVLPDHTADNFAAWLREHPGVRMVCRDRGGAFAEAAERALPGVPQVADRWHLLGNLATAVVKAVRRHRACLAPPKPERTIPEPEASPDSDSEENPAHQRIRARWTEIHTAYERGATITAISEQTGLDRKTVRRYAHADTADELITVRPRRGSTLTPHMPYLAARWAEGCNNAQTLRDEIAARGYTGGRKTVRRFLNSLTEKELSPMKPSRHHPSARWSGGSSAEPSARAKPPASSSRNCASAATTSPRSTGSPAASPLFSGSATATDFPDGSPGLTHPTSRRPGPAQRPRRGHRRPDTPLDLRTSRRPREPDQDAQTPDLRPREFRTPATANTPLRLTTFTEIAEDPELNGL
ncbi:transposase [Streptomyces sp. NPDC059816]|uniref:transposase n=1 Tax=Streptomyces sp. NPDC059816 TaxID=3346960 RepID=UPI00364ED451